MSSREGGRSRSSHGYYGAISSSGGRRPGGDRPRLGCSSKQRLRAASTSPAWGTRLSSVIVIHAESDMCASTARCRSSARSASSIRKVTFLVTVITLLSVHDTRAARFVCRGQDPIDDEYNTTCSINRFTNLLPGFWNLMNRVLEIPP